MGRDRSKCSKKYRRIRGVKSATSEDDDDDRATCFTTTTATSCEQQQQEHCKKHKKSKRQCSCRNCDHKKPNHFETPQNLRKRMISILSPSVSNKNLTNILSTDTSDIFADAAPTKKCSRRNTSRKPVRKACSKRNTSKHSHHKSCKSTNCNHNGREGCHRSKPPLRPPPELPKCQVCCKTFDSPILLSCGHTFCKSCVGVFVEASDGTSFRCPVCETDIKLSGDEEELFCPNFVILKNIDQDGDDSYDSILCAVCSTDNEAEFYCETCQDLLCDGCADAHSVVKYTKNHCIREIDCSTDLSALAKKKYYCTEHESQPLDTYCVTCEKCICQKCVQQLHRSDKHLCKPIATAAQKVKDGMRRQVYDFKARSPSLQLALMDLKHAKKRLREQTNATYAEINESMVRIMTSLKEHEKKLYKKLEDVCQTKAASLKAQKHRVVVNLEKFEALGNLLQQLSNHDSDIETLQMRATIRACADNLDDFTASCKGFQSSVLFNSNEIKLQKELNKHGEIFHYTTTKKKKKKLTQQLKNIENYYIVSNFTDHVSLENSSEPSILSDVFLRKNAKKVRAKSNWMIVKSSLPDIIRSDRARATHKTGRSNKSLSRISARKSEMSRARKQKAKANWMILKSHLSDITESDQSNVGESQRQRSSTIPNLSTVYSKRKMKLRGKRSRAIRQRAEANWLLVRSKLSDIVDYGHVTGRLFTPIERKLFRKRPSPTIMKLKHFRAITLRARSNWLLVASRLQDIAKYRQKMKTTRSKEKVTWDSYLNELAANRRRATRNKYVAGVLRARANWMIVRSRLPDIVLYGKYQKYSLRQHSPPDRSRSSSPAKRSASKQGLNGSNVSLNRSPSKQSLRETHKRLPSKHSKKDETSRKHELRTSKIPIAKTMSKSKVKTAMENWHKLVQHKPAKKRSSSIKAKQKDTFKHFDNLIQGTYSNNDHAALKNWDGLVRDTPTKSNDTRDKRTSNNKSAWANWDSLISNTSAKNDVKRSSSLKAKTAPYNNWDVLVQNTSREIKDTSSLRSQDAFKNWDNLLRTWKNGDPQKRLQDWDQLIVGTSTLSPSRRAKSEESVSRNSQGEKNWFRLYDEAKREKRNADNNWHRLTENAHYDKKYADENWANLVSYTPSIKTKPAERAKKRWDKIKTSLGRSSKDGDQMVVAGQSALTSKQQHKAYQNWWVLASGVQNNTRSSKRRVANGDADVREKAVRKKDEFVVSGTQASACDDWNKLMRGTHAPNVTGKNQQALEDWARFIHGTRIEETPAQDNDDVSISHWSNLIQKTSTSETGPNEDAVADWHRLIQLVNTADSEDEIQTAINHWHHLMYATKASPPFDTLAALHHWEKLIEGRIIRQKATKVTSLSATARDEMLKQIHNYASTSGGEPPAVFQKTSSTPPTGVTLLYDKSRSSTPGYHEPKVMRLNIKDENGKYNDVKVKLTSPNKSMLSAHLKENGDGTFTIFYCPTTDGVFNIAVSLHGAAFSSDVDVLNFKGNFSSLRTEQDMRLACRTISLIRWQLTPGLLVRQGEKILAAR